MNAEELAQVLEDLIRAVVEDEDGDPTELQGARLVSFARAGLLTNDAGFVVELVDGSEFQISVIQSRSGEHSEEDIEDDAP